MKKFEKIFFAKIIFGAFCSEGREEQLLKISAKSDRQLSRYNALNMPIVVITHNARDNGSSCVTDIFYLKNKKQKKLTTNCISDVNFVAFAKNKPRYKTRTDFFAIIKKLKVN